MLLLLELQLQLGFGFGLWGFLVFSWSEVCFIDIVTKACDNETAHLQDRMTAGGFEGDANDANERIIKL